MKLSDRFTQEQLNEYKTKHDVDFDDVRDLVSALEDAYRDIDKLLALGEEEHS